MTAQADILQKLDALLNKHRAGSRDASDIPVLTEVVDMASAYPEAAHQAAMPGKDGRSSASELSDAEVELLARDIYQRVIGKLNSQISSELRVHLTERLSSIIDSTVGAAVADFKQELANTVADAIAEALLSRAEKMIVSEDTPRT